VLGGGGFDLGVIKRGMRKLDQASFLAQMQAREVDANLNKLFQGEFGDNTNIFDDAPRGHLD
jgi:hypothetical protein